MIAYALGTLVLIWMLGGMPGGSHFCHRLLSSLGTLRSPLLWLLLLGLNFPLFWLGLVLAMLALNWKRPSPRPAPAEVDGIGISPLAESGKDPAGSVLAGSGKLH